MITSESIASSGYDGWVVWVDDGGTTRIPIFEAVLEDVALPALISGAKTGEQRKPGRQTVEWKNLPHEKVSRLELYAYREVYEQPCWRADREPGSDVRFMALKMGGIQVSALGPTTNMKDAKKFIEESEQGTHRSGIGGYRMGWWNMKMRESGLWEITVFHRKSLGVRGHPCWPRPYGWALSPTIFGLTEKDIPEVR